MATIPNLRDRAPASLKHSTSLDSASGKEKLASNAPKHDVEVAHDSDEEQSPELYSKIRPYILTAFALLILGWWISSTILKTTRHRW